MYYLDGVEGGEGGWGVGRVWLEGSFIEGVWGVVVFFGWVL